MSDSNYFEAGFQQFGTLEDAEAHATKFGLGSIGFKRNGKSWFGSRKNVKRALSSSVDGPFDLDQWRHDRTNNKGDL